MKMRSFWGKRGLSVFTSLVLCTSLVMPSFAANLIDLQNAVRGTYEGDAFEVSGDDSNRKVILKDNVIREDATGPVAICTGSNGAANVTIDLGGFTIDSKDVNSAFEVKNGSTLTVQDSSEKQTGTITGGNGNGNGTVHVTSGSEFTLASGTISGNKNGAGVKVDDGSSFTMNGGDISGNSSSGVYVEGGTFIMNGGTISGNTTNYSGGGVGVNGLNGSSSFEMNGGVISDNTAKNQGGEGGGGGVWVKGGEAKFTMNGGEITGNTVVESPTGGGNGGGVAIHQSNFEMTGGKIYGNSSPRGTGVLINATEGQETSYFKMSGGSVSGDGESCIYLEEGGGRNAYFELSGDAIMAGAIHLGKGTQLITENVMQPGGDHPYTGFDVTYEDGTTDKLGKDETESSATGGKGYEAGGNISADVKYNCTPDESAWVEADGGHKHPCKTCKELLGAPEPHSWSDWVQTDDGRTRTCKDCGAKETTTHNWGDWEPIDGGQHKRTCELCRFEEFGTHSWGGWSNAGNGEHSRICVVCHDVETAVHREDEWGDWSYSDEGHTRIQTCPDCGATVGTESGEHSWGEWEATDDGRTRTCKDCLATEEIKEPGTEPEEPVTPVTPTPVTPTPGTPPAEVIEDPAIPLAPAPEEEEDVLEEIEDDAVPLAGLLTRADAIGYLWEQAGSPDAELSDFADVPEDHEWAVAIGWAQEMGIAVADEEGNFLPDDLLLRSSDEPEGEFQEFLNRYAVFAGIELDDGELFIELDGDPDDIVMGEDAQVVFDGFFARLETALARRRD